MDSMKTDFTNRITGSRKFSSNHKTSKSNNSDGDSPNHQILIQRQLFRESKHSCVCVGHEVHPMEMTQAMIDQYFKSTSKEKEKGEDDVDEEEEEEEKEDDDKEEEEEEEDMNQENAILVLEAISKFSIKFEKVVMGEMDRIARDEVVLAKVIELGKQFGFKVVVLFPPSELVLGIKDPKKHMIDTVNTIRQHCGVANLNQELLEKDPFISNYANYLTLTELPTRRSISQQVMTGGKCHVQFNPVMYPPTVLGDHNIDIMCNAVKLDRLFRSSVKYVFSGLKLSVILKFTGSFLKNQTKRTRDDQDDGPERNDLRLNPFQDHSQPPPQPQDLLDKIEFIRDEQEYQKVHDYAYGKHVLLMEIEKNWGANKDVAQTKEFYEILMLTQDPNTRKFIQDKLDSLNRYVELKGQMARLAALMYRFRNNPIPINVKPKPPIDHIHRRIESTPNRQGIQCTTCQESFLPQDIKSHLVKCHDKDGMVKCPVCQRMKHLEFIQEHIAECDLVKEIDNNLPSYLKENRINQEPAGAMVRRAVNLVGFKDILRPDGEFLIANAIRFLEMEYNHLFISSLSRYTIEPSNRLLIQELKSIYRLEKFNVKGIYKYIGDLAGSELTHIPGIRVPSKRPNRRPASMRTGHPCLYIHCKKKVRNVCPDWPKYRDAPYCRTKCARANRVPYSNLLVFHKNLCNYSWNGSPPCGGSILAYARCKTMCYRHHREEQTIRYHRDKGLKTRNNVRSKRVVAPLQDEELVDDEFESTEQDESMDELINVNLIDEFESIQHDGSTDAESIDELINQEESIDEDLDVDVMN
ncbi:hypothetical protein DFA_10231 [Cavenderia fasciculata]|uniref:Uncharacterized protein n=1 Tax=Cavenderia fasciculata TaxID=261658 RepID=F4Q9M8_CACFS|nr:uncharacterized protein DFA_10231 [Cavenderia fasciculata]EGG15397.1 hypothetical protein DFA_10231 [Cavenderia fasciculata]|eukprot:XP_004354139.1 hypothetical protein DFA_10231 [Cavenderia fasciculata]